MAHLSLDMRPLGVRIGVATLVGIADIVRQFVAAGARVQEVAVALRVGVIALLAQEQLAIFPGIGLGCAKGSAANRRDVKAQPVD